MLPKDRLCPVLSVVSEGKLVVIRCKGEECALFRGSDKTEDGICAINDISGWLKNLHGLAAMGEKSTPVPIKIIEDDVPRLEEQAGDEPQGDEDD